MKGARRSRAWLACAACLVAWAVGVEARAAETSPPGPVVELPPMVVEESTNLPPWLYVRVGNMEYLSRCSTTTTREYVAMHHDRMQWVHALFPPAFLLKMDVPVSTLLLSQKLKPSNNAELIGEVLGIGRDRSQHGYVRATVAPNMMLNDDDSVGVFAYVDEDKFDRDRLTISSDFVRFLLERRQPALPAWLQEGMMAVYNDVIFTDRPITLRPLGWISAREARGLAKDPQAPRTLLAASEMFALKARHSERMAADVIAVAQSGLLVRWALDPRNGVREVFWRFAAQACEEPVTEAMFESHFGFGFSDLRDRLSDYLPAAIKEPLQLAPGKLAATPALSLRRATPTEIARMRGEWERLSLVLMRRRYPDHATRYLEQARRTLQRAYDANERDPRLLATFGLLELAAANPGAARDFLEQAVQHGVVKPSARLELARLRWTGLTKDRATSEVGADDIGPMAELLRPTFAQTPLLPEAFGLLADMHARCATKPAPEDFDLLIRGGTLFPADAPLGFRVVRALARHGKQEEALQLLGRGFSYASDDTTRGQFAQWYRALTKSHAALPKP